MLKILCYGKRISVISHGLPPWPFIIFDFFSTHTIYNYRILRKGQIIFNARDSNLGVKCPGSGGSLMNVI